MPFLSSKRETSGLCILRGWSWHDKTVGTYGIPCQVLSCGLLWLGVLWDRLVDLLLGREKSALMASWKGRLTPSLWAPCKTLCKPLISHSANTAFFPGSTVPRRPGCIQRCSGLRRVCHSVIFTLVPLLGVTEGPGAKWCFIIHFMSLNSNYTILPTTLCFLVVLCQWW